MYQYSGVRLFSPKTKGNRGWRRQYLSGVAAAIEQLFNLIPDLAMRRCILGRDT